jgi:hypothetical protein
VLCASRPTDRPQPAALLEYSLPFHRRLNNN